MNDIKQEEQIENFIYEVRGKQVMLDSDLAILYKVETKRINEAVRRNPAKFPERFAWVLTEDETVFLRSQNATLKSKNMGRGTFSKYASRVFTEQGVAMLATILKSSVAIEISIKIMDAFVAMRKYINQNNVAQRLSNVEQKIIEHDTKFNIIFDKMHDVKNTHIFFEGQIYDAYSLMLDIIDTAVNNVIIIDNYIDKNLLDIISQTEKQITIITKCISEINRQKYNEEYSNLIIYKNKSFHDRFMIIDNKHLYHCGDSFKDLGKKCFAINKIEDKEILNKLLKEID